MEGASGVPAAAAPLKACRGSPALLAEPVRVREKSLLCTASTRRVTLRGMLEAAEDALNCRAGTELGMGQAARDSAAALSSAGPGQVRLKLS